MGFVPINKRSDSIEEQLINDVWVLLKGHTRNIASVESLKLVLLYIIGARIPEMEITS